jgi:hypothetical protein
LADLPEVEEFFNLIVFLVLWQECADAPPVVLFHQKQLNQNKMEQKKEFMFVFRFEPDFNRQPTSDELSEMHQHWGAFIGNIALQEKLVSTHQLGFEGKQIFADRSVKEGIHVADNYTLGGNMVVRANSVEEAVELAKSCPILTMGGTVEVRTIQPM